MRYDYITEGGKTVTQRTLEQTLTARRIRDLLDGQVDEGYHVRCYRDGDVWVFPRSDRHRLEIKTVLEHSGLTCLCDGKPGTSGEWIIEVSQQSE